MSYYIGPTGSGEYQATVTLNGVTRTEEFPQFHKAVKWVEKLQNEDRKNSEIVRDQEST